jgi:hypothetical protein
MTPRNDLDICREIRRIMVKHWIDMGRLSVRSQKGNVMLYGNLRRIEGAQTALIPPLVDEIISQIRRIQGCRMVRTYFENWKYEDGGWRRSEQAAPREEQRLHHVHDPLRQERLFIPDDGKATL